MNKGSFITLEGGEGMGKTSNMAFIREFLERHGKQVIATREPGGTPVGETIRSLFLGQGDVAPKTELLLVFASRAQHLRDVIEPALESGAWVVCDRFTDASYAYQGGGRQVDVAAIFRLEEMVQEGRKPDLTLLFDAPVEVGLARAKQRGGSDRMETETLAFHQRVREAYLQLAGNFPQRIKIIDAARPLAEVQAAIADHLTVLCGQ
jgi:dTMP kinase